MEFRVLPDAQIVTFNRFLIIIINRGLAIVARDFIHGADFIIGQRRLVSQVGVRLVAMKVIKRARNFFFFFLSFSFVSFQLLFRNVRGRREIALGSGDSCWLAFIN